MKIFDRLESNVRSYCRDFPTVFTKARNARLEDRDGNEYIDFFAGAGALNYGSNNPVLKEKLIEYIAEDGITHSLDMATGAKQHFLELLEANILRPRELDYRVQFTGPTGANAVEAALKLARKVTGRHNVIAFTNGYHGLSLGSLAATASAHYRNAGGVPLSGATFAPFDGYMGPDVDTMAYLEQILGDSGSGVDLPAAVIVETIQGQGGINVARKQWLQRLAQLCRQHDIVLIVDDIQMGCGRTGSFFSFEEARLTPDLVVLSKSISGYGLPMSVVLIRPDLDHWKPAEHTGTFRGNNLAFVTAAAALEHYWADDAFSREIQHKGRICQYRLAQMNQRLAGGRFSVRGRGLIQAIDCRTGELARAVCHAAFERGLIIETSGARGQVVKCIPPLTIGDSELEVGLDILEASLESCLQGEFRNLVDEAPEIERGITPVASTSHAVISAW